MSTPPDPRSKRSKRRRRAQRGAERQQRWRRRWAMVNEGVATLESLFYPLGPSSRRGQEFELWAGHRLAALADLFPTVVDVARQEPLDLTNGLRVIPDFRLEVSEPEGKQIRIIECQNRRRISNEILQKCRDIRNHSRHNRMMLVYGDERYLTRRAAAALEADGIVHYDANGFVAFLARIGWKLYRLDSRCLKGGDLWLKPILETMTTVESTTEAELGTAALGDAIARSIQPNDPVSFLSSAYAEQLHEMRRILKARLPKDEGMLGSL